MAAARGGVGGRHRSVVEVAGRVLATQWQGIQSEGIRAINAEDCLCTAGYTPGVAADLKCLCLFQESEWFDLVRDANVGHQLAGGNSSWCPELEV